MNGLSKVKLFAGIIAWIIDGFVYFILTLLGWGFSILIILYSMSILTRGLDSDGNTGYYSLGRYPRWAWLWTPINEAWIEGVCRLNNDMNCADKTPYAQFIRRLFAFFKPKDTNLNSVLLAYDVNRYNLLNQENRIYYNTYEFGKFTHILASIESNTTYNVWRWQVLLRKRVIVDLGWNINTSNQKRYLARYLFCIKTPFSKKECSK